MLVELPGVWIVLLNVLGIPTIHLSLSWMFVKLPQSSFDPEFFLFRERLIEQGGVVYQTLLRVRRWKGLLPDAAPWFGGFAKGKFQDKDPDYLRNFIIETCRGEAAHYAQNIALFATLIWNPWPVAALAMVVYSVVSNLPCIILQRFTRARLRHFLAEIEQNAE